MLDYENLSDGSEGRKHISSTVEEVSEVAHIGPWRKRRDRGNSITYTYNNRASDGRVPLVLTIKEDTVVKLTTTAYGESTIQGGMCSVARKGFRKEESALDWFHDNFTTEDN